MYFLLLIWIPSAASIQLIEVGDLNESYSLNDHVEYVVDDLGEYNAEQLMLPEQQWLKHNKETLSFGYTRSTYWFRFAVQNSTNTSINHLLEIAYPVLDNISMYIYDAKNGLQVVQHTLGDKMPFKSRQIQHRNFVVPLDLEPAQKQVWLLRIKTSSAMQVPMKIWPDRQFFLGDQARLMGLGVYYGIMFIMVLYNLFVFMSVREENYLYYVLYVASMAVFLASLQGLSFQYIWPNATSWNDSVIIVMLAGVVVFACLFTRNFLFLSDGEEKLNLAFGIVIISSAFIALSVNFISYAILIQTLIAIAVIGISLSIYSGILRWGQGYSSARYYTIAWSAVLLGGVILALNKINFIPRNFFTENAIQLGSVLEVILLSFALAERLNQEKGERFEAQITALNHERIASAAQAEALEQERFARAAQEKALVHEREAREAQARALAIQNEANENLEHKVRERTNELESVNEKLAELSTTDALTGVRNRRYFDQMLEREFNRARREREQLSILMLDIDFFKRINDEYGHQVGDDALRRVANALREVLHRTTDFVARYGGEEFAIILPNTEVAGAYLVAEKIRKKIAKQPFDAAGITFSITVSIGIMGDEPSSGSSADFWLKEADDALYKAKEGGRNKVVISTACPKKSHPKQNI
ncbi:MAG: diguanylate cyclase (GGDEF)-like protein [Oleispira sp.]|jgi:diguanylate cyclase (GGDEF)-like protein